jgi:hypothetical protein
MNSSGVSVVEVVWSFLVSAARSPTMIRTAVRVDRDGRGRLPRAVRSARWRPHARSLESPTRLDLVSQFSDYPRKLVGEWPRESLGERIRELLVVPECLVAAGLEAVEDCLPKCSVVEQDRSALCTLSASETRSSSSRFDASLAM